MRAHFSELDATHLTFAISLMNALNRIAVGMRRGPTVKKG
jgi:alkylhydroperoxidase family enzyme